MRIYLVNVNLTASGVISKFLSTLKEMKLYLAGGGGKQQILKEMKLYLAGGYTGNLKPFLMSI